MPYIPTDDAPDCLESWKAIARYFGRSERTVRRWETIEGLPIHRHAHQSGSTVFAFRHELAAWRDARAVGRVNTPSSQGVQPNLQVQSYALPAMRFTACFSSAVPKKLAAFPAPGRRGVFALALAMMLCVGVVYLAQSTRLMDSGANKANAAFERPEMALALRLERRGQVEAAKAVLRTAVVHDPTFALAYAELARLHFVTGDGVAALSLVERAGAEKTAGDVERRYVNAIRALVHRNFRGAVDAMEVLVAAAPDNPLFLRRLSDVCVNLPAYGSCVGYAKRLATMEPRRLDAIVVSAQVNLLAGASVGQIREDVKEIATRLRYADVLERPALAVKAALFEARVAWVQGDIDASISAFGGVESAFKRWPDGARDALAQAAGEHMLALGRFQSAQDWFSHISSPTKRHEARAARYFAQFDMKELAAHLARGSGYRSPFTVLALSMVGNTERADALVEVLAHDSIVSPDLQLLQGKLAFDAGEFRVARQALRVGVQAGLGAHGWVRLIGADALSTIEENEGRMHAALDVLETMVDTRSAAALDGAGAVWLICQSHLARLYRRMGRHQDAGQIDAMLVKMLRQADSGHPLLASL